MNAIAPKIVSRHTPDGSSLSTLVAGLIRPGMSSEEKAIAVWRFCWQHTYHWPAPREGARARHELDVVYDAFKQLNVYGYTYCFAIRSLAEALYEAAGLEARSGGIGGHVIAETHYEGRYRYLDHDQRGFTRLRDGTIAALTDYRNRPEQVFDPPGRSRPCFPSATRPYAPYEQALIFAGYLAGQTRHYRQHDKYRAMHAMTLALRPGERFIRRWDHDGKWHWSPGLTDGYVDPLDGPRDPYHGLHKEAPRGENGAARSFGNGLLLYRPNLAASSRDFEDGACEAIHIRRGGLGFGPARSGQVARAAFRVRLPYIIVGWPRSADKPDIVGAAVASGRYRRRTANDRVALAVSTDEGATWKTVWQARALGERDFAVDLSRHVEGRYAYRIRFELRAARSPADARILALGMDTACQLNPAMLPAVRPGRNRMTLTLDPAPEAYEASIQYGKSGRAAHKRHLCGRRGLRVQKAAIPRLMPVRRGAPGHVDYQIVAPAGQKVVRASAGGAFRSSTPPKPGERFRMLFQTDRQKTWTPLWQADLPPYLGHWCFEAERPIPLPHPVETVRIRYELQRDPDPESEGGGLAEARLAWGCADGSTAMPKGGLLVTHEWREGETARRRRHVYARAGQADAFAVRASAVTNLSVAMEWAGRPPVADEPHPAMTRRPAGIPADAARDRKRDRMRADLARLNRNPTLATVLDLKKNSESEWVRNGMSAALIALKGPKADAARRAAARAGDVRVREYLEQRLFDTGPLSAVRRELRADIANRRALAARALARRGLTQGLPALRQARGRETDPTALAAMTAAWLRLETSRAVPDPFVLPAACDKRGHLEIAAALAAIGRAQAWPLLAEAARDPDLCLRCQAASDAADSRRPQAEPLLRSLLDDPSRWVRQAAIAGLARCGTSRSRAALRRVAQRDPEAWLRAEARWAARCLAAVAPQGV